MFAEKFSGTTADSNAEKPLAAIFSEFVPLIVLPLYVEELKPPVGAAPTVPEATVADASVLKVAPVGSVTLKLNCAVAFVKPWLDCEKL
jgi:hypothetical protein